MSRHIKQSERNERGILQSPKRSMHLESSEIFSPNMTLAWLGMTVIS